MPTSRPLLRFLAKLLLAVLPPLALLGFLELQHARHPEGLDAKALAWQTAAPQARILILGSSHAWYGIDPSAFSQPAFNLAYVSQTLHFDSALLVLSMARMPRLSLVIQTVSPFTLEEELDRLPEGARSWSYRRAFGIQPPPGLPGLDSRRFSRTMFVGNWRSLRLATRGFRPDPRQIGIQADGWLDHHPDPDQTDPSVLAPRRLAEWRSSMDAARLPVQKARLRHMLEACRARGVRMVLVTTPLRQELSKGLDPAARAATRTFLDSLGREGTTWIDLESSPRWGAADFVDMDHLNRAAARRLGLVLDSLLVPRQR